MPLTLASDAITFTDNTVLSSAIIGTAQLSAGAVTADKVTSLPSNVVTTQTIANSAVTASKMSGNQPGIAPVYGCRAWFAFDATRDSSGNTNQNNTNRFIFGSGNISSITRLPSDRYRVTFSTSMPSTNYATIVNGNIGTFSTQDTYIDPSTRTLSSFDMGMSYAGGVYTGSLYVTGIVFA